jgi:membrane peptidoglycan carboxypeptidase
MSDTPPSKSERGDTPISGGWQSPTTPGGWKAPETDRESAWRVPALPTDLPDEVGGDGGWRLPAPQDTIYGPEDELEVHRPEDELMISPPPEDQRVAPARVSDALAPEDLIPAQNGTSGDAAPAPGQTASSVPLAPEDLIYMIEHIDETDDDFAVSGGFSELVALASLAEREPGAGALPGEASPIPGGASTDTGASAPIDLSTLSRSERVVMQSSGAPASDAAEYARQQLALLGVDDAPAAGSIGAVTTPTGATGADPGDYARQQLALLGDTGAISGTSLLQTESPATVIENLNPRQRDLLRRYRETEDRVGSLRRMMQAGQISQDDFINQLRDLMILDDDQVWWMMGVETDTWYKSENNEWVPAVPDVIQLDQRLQQGPGAGRVDPNTLVNDSLPYLPDSPVTFPSQSNTLQFTEASAGTRMDDYGMPLPKTGVPINDPDFTVPNPALINLNTLQGSAQPTVPGQSYLDVTVPSPTVPAQPVDYGRVEAPVDLSAPPEFAVEAAEEESLYVDAVERRRRSQTRALLLAATIFVVVIFLIGAAFIVFALVWYDSIVDQYAPQIIALGDYQPEFQTVRILDSDGIELASLTRDGGADRLDVTLDEVSPYFLHALLSLQDTRYYQHPGWDLGTTIGAFWQNLTSGEISTDGDTITQAVARNFVLGTGSSPQVDEIVVAGQITRRYTKSEILELYVNELNFGNEAFGVEAASRFYFNKGAAELNMAQAAMLAAMVSGPTLLEPVSAPDPTFDAMQEAMDRMVEVGCLSFQHDWPGSGAEDALGPLPAGQDLCIDSTYRNDRAVVLGALVEASPYRPRQVNTEFPHFVQVVQNQLESYYGSDVIYREGFVVRTSLVREIQETAEDALIDRVEALSSSGINTGAVMVSDPLTGYILAMVGSPDFDNDAINGSVNGALQWHAPGAAIQPILYTAAMEGVDRNSDGSITAGEYYSSATVLWDVPTQFQIPGQPTFTPTNFDGEYHGPISFRRAVQSTYEVPAIKTFAWLGEAGFVNTARDLGLRFQEGATFPLTTATGTVPVRLYDMMVAYGTLANDGIRAQTVTGGGVTFNLRTIVSVTTSRGTEVPLPVTLEPIQAVRQDIAYVMQNILSDNTTRSIEFPNSALYIEGTPQIGAVAAVAGSTQNGSDVWTMGFASNLTVGVWLGRHDGEATSIGQNGRLAAAPLWNTVMRTAIQQAGGSGFGPLVQNVTQGTVCATTGEIFNQGAACPQPINELWSVARPPLPAGQGVVVTREIDSWSGLLANQFCSTDRIQATFTTIDDQFAVQWINTTAPGRQWAQQLGLTVPLNVAPTAACDQSTPISAVSITQPQGGQTVEGQLPIRGQINANGFQRYQLEYALEGSTAYTIMPGSQSTTPQPNPDSLLATWDTRAVADGNYTLRLAVFGQNNGYLYRLVSPVIVNNPEPTATPTLTPAPIIPTAVPAPINPLPFPEDATPGAPTPTLDLSGG